MHHSPSLPEEKQIIYFMIKFIVTLFFFSFLSFPVYAQDIYNALLNDAKKAAENPKSNPVSRKIAQFKRVGLEYIKEKAFKSDKEVTVKFLDDQAYYMNQFVSSFIRDALVNTSLSKSEKKKRILLFIDASGSNRLFNDPDREVADAYVTTEGQLTPFSLDTDWVKAYAAVQSVLEKGK